MTSRKTFFATLFSLRGQMIPGEDHRRYPADFLASLLALIVLACLPTAVMADPDYGDFFLPGLDPVIRATDDPRLLGVERGDLRNRLLAMGVDPLRDPLGRPTLETTVMAHIKAKMNINFEHDVEVLENNGQLGLFSKFRYPAYFFLFQNPEELPGGFLYYPPRPVDADEVELFLDDPEVRLLRSQGIAQIARRREALDVMGAADRGARDQGLINLTIPVKLPRTLEKIIGRGEKTQIRISGREHISIGGESTVSNQFVPNERISKQSLFPTLDMEQQLQVNLNGTIGEKIHIDVEHNSQAMGSEGTKIRLTYEGTEDEVVKSIETGDVGLTLPGSQLLGYSSNKSGLFGIKVTGQVGRADITLVASKQKSESAGKSFNSQGGEVGEHIIDASDYIDNRFFRLDLPPVMGIEPFDNPGRYIYNQNIDPNSILVYKFVGAVTPGLNDIDNVAVAIDTTGVWGETSWLDETTADPTAWTRRERWRKVEFDPWTDQNGTFIAIDLKTEMDTNDLIAVTYNVVNSEGEFLYSVGDRPDADEVRGLTHDGVDYLRMKLLKPTQRDAVTFQYVLRNIYRLGGTNIDAQSFDLRIEYKSQAEHPELDTTSSVPWIQVFGLDQYDLQGIEGADGLVDRADPFLFDLRNGLLKFPLSMPWPFNADPAVYDGYASGTDFEFASSDLADATMDMIYNWSTTPSLYGNYSTFQFVVEHAAASSSFNLGVSNIEEGSETVTLDGRSLTRDVDYEIDYMFGEIQLKGDAAASLTADSKIGVNYQYAPFFGGGQSNLLGFHVGYDLGQQSKLNTAWLYESNQIIGEKAKLGEEPSRNIVGNMSANHEFKPYFLTHIANFLSRRDSERESSLQLSGELAISLPNANTKNNAYLEDFEGIDSSDMISMSRIGWYGSSAPWLLDPNLPDTGISIGREPADRVETRWFIPRTRVKRLYLNPGLIDRERNETQQALHVHMNAGSGGWQPESWGGIMRGLSRVGVDLSKAQFVELWVNDNQQIMANRRGKLHIDFGYISEDFFWPDDGSGELETHTWQYEDANRDGVFTHEEDIGLDGVSGGDVYGAEYVSDDDPFPEINGTELNNREDDEDLNGNTVQDLDNSFFSVVIDLADPEMALIDIATDYADSAGVMDKLDGTSWRKYRIRLGDTVEVREGGTVPDIHAVTHVRIWYEDDQVDAPEVVDLQLSELSFLGSRWEREGIRSATDETNILTDSELGPYEGFFLGEINNKEDAGYEPPPDLPIRVVNKIPELEQSLVLDFQELQTDHMIRVSKQVSPRGDDYTLYDRLSWYWYNLDAALNDVDLFFRVGADTLNYYEVNYRFSESDTPVGWEHLTVDMAELANVKTERDSTELVITSTIADAVTGANYDVRVVGSPDLRRVKNYYFGVKNETEYTVSGKFYMNDVRLEGVKREMGLAERVSVRLNMAEVIKVDFDWSQRDAEFHGLDTKVGQGYRNEDWNLSSNLKVDDFIPLLGFTMPVSYSRRQTVKEPKYETNSDIEILDDERVKELSTIDERESFSARLSHLPSRAAIPRYLIDPWSFSVSGSRTQKRGPLERADQKSLQGAVTYDLRIVGKYTLGKYPLLRKLWIVKGVSFLPKRISFGASFNNTDNQSSTIDLSGNETARPQVVNERGNLTGSVEHDPLEIFTAGYNLRSDRDLLRRNLVAGINIGEETNFTQEFRLTFKALKASSMPDGKFFYPLRLTAKGINKIRPTLNFNGGFADNHDPNIRQPGDPDNIRSVSNNGNWELRFKMPVGEVFKKVFPEKKHSDVDRQRLIDQQRLRDQQNRGRRGEPAPGSQEQEGQTQQHLTPEEQRRRDEEDLLARAEQYQEDERIRQEERRAREARLAERGFSQPTPESTETDSTEVVPPGAEASAVADSIAVEQPGPAATTTTDSTLVSELIIPEPAASDTTLAAPDTSAVAASAEQPETESRDQSEQQTGSRISIPNPFSWVLSILRGTQPVQFNLSNRKTSSYARLLAATPFGYELGLEPDLDVPDSLYSVSNVTGRRQLTVSTSLQLARDFSVDVKFGQNLSSRDQVGLLTKSYQQDWPDVRLSLSGLEKWGILGGSDEVGQGFFARSSFDVSYKYAKAVDNYTETTYNPRRTTTINPRWNFSFHNKMTASLNTNITKDRSDNRGTVTTADKLRIGMQLNHEFRAQALLVKLGLYRPGNIPTIKMNVDVSFSQESTKRVMPNTDQPSSETGQMRIAVNPRFSYQISRNLDGALRLTFSRNKDKATDLTTTSFGIGLEATFVF